MTIDWFLLATCIVLVVGMSIMLERLKMPYFLKFILLAGFTFYMSGEFVQVEVP